MAKLADFTEAPLLFPQGADHLATHGSLTVSKRAAVTLKRQIATPKLKFLLWSSSSLCMCVHRNLFHTTFYITY